MSRASSPRPRVAALAAGLGLVLLSSACGVPDEDGGTAATATGDPGAVPAGTVVMRDHELVPREITVVAGASVTWVNDDEVDHWVVGLEPNVLDSGEMGKDSSYRQAFPRPGTYRYYCKIHNYMKGTVTVS